MCGLVDLLLDGAVQVDSLDEHEFLPRSSVYLVLGVGHPDHIVPGHGVDEVHHDIHSVSRDTSHKRNTEMVGIHVEGRAVVIGEERIDFIGQGGMQMSLKHQLVRHKQYSIRSNCEHGCLPELQPLEQPGVFVNHLTLLEVERRIGLV